MQAAPTRDHFFAIFYVFAFHLVAAEGRAGKSM